MEKNPAASPSERHVPPLIETDERVDLLLDYAACSPTRGEPETWGATPASISESLIDQALLIHGFARRHVVPNTFADTDPSIVNYIERKSIERFINRCLANDKNYIRALSPNPFAEVDDNRNPRLGHIEELAKKGRASPAELLALQGIHRIGAIELASLTHPYNANIEYLTPMRRTVEQAVRLFGGEIPEEPEVYFSISDVINEIDPDVTDQQAYDALSRTYKITNRDTLGPIKGLLMTRKRTVGYLPDGTVVRERTSFVLTKESGLLNDDLLQRFADVPACEHWGREAIHQVEGLAFMLTGMLERDETQKIIPVASTIYSFNKERLNKIERDIENFTITSPLAITGHGIHDNLRNLAAERLYRAAQEGMAGGNQRNYQDLNGMAFFKDEGQDDSAESSTQQ